MNPSTSYSKILPAHHSEALSNIELFVVVIVFDP
jgi:hypothetical protein